MSTLGNGLPDLPPEWGEVVIPDDPAELAVESESVRRELRDEARKLRRAQSHARWRRRLRLPERVDDPEQPSLLLPLLVLGITILITLLSLLLIAWPSLTRQPPAQIDPGPSIVAPATCCATPAGNTWLPLWEGSSATDLERADHQADGSAALGKGGHLDDPVGLDQGVRR